ncbi:hypothetical protein HHL17_09545 [Chitinophaga sp. G-6-1-13]|uniref:HD domain-containing protein n=1 Tax=Chitinophaga fulva TaxID=2728842 RepID=A0A848GHZ2_9BACT|nr:hypothetical protein [Chitinophaga fulva]NML37437.1 hypothetical protein [Chitinophaga fulva]
MASPYITHVLRIMQMGRTNEEKIVGMLHDVVEERCLPQYSSSAYPGEII